MLKKRYLITGAGGTIGLALLENLLKNKKNTICAFESDEEKLFNISKKFLKFKNNINLFLGNIRDKERLDFAMEKVDVVFHCAALKHVALNEYNPFELKKTNVDGIENLIDTSIKQKVKKVIFTSSDKAVNPTNLMGISKMFGERLITSSNNRVGANPTRFSCIRFGNVIDSSGSIIPIFRDQILKRKPLTVTHKNMTRFFIDIKNSVELCLYAEKNMIGGEIFVKNMSSIKINDIAKILSRKYKLPIKYIGIFKGEKLYEELFTADEARRSYSYNNYIWIFPERTLRNFTSNEIKKINKIKKYGLKFNRELRSDDNTSDFKYIEKLIKL